MKAEDLVLTIGVGLDIQPEVRDFLNSRQRALVIEANAIRKLLGLAPVHDRDTGRACARCNLTETP